MATPTIPYRRIRGLGTSAFEYFRLYFGPDHLLLVTSSGHTENYKRFYFRDVQSITVRKTNLGKAWNIAWGVLFWIFGIVVALEAGGAMYFWMGVAAIFLFLLILNIGRGPTCITQITTAVQTRTLPPLNRLRRARAIVAQLKPLIEAAQGTLSSDELAQHLDQVRRGVTPVVESQPTAAAVPTTAPAPSETSLPPSG